MDHSIAHLMKFSNDAIISTTIEAGSTLPAKEQNMGVHERLLHNREKSELTAYYSKLSDAIKDYDEVLLFGPTDAKIELFNLLKKNHLFEKIKIETKTVDKMTENQQHIYLKEYFKQVS